MIIRFRNYLPLGNMLLRWFSEAVVYRCFSKRVFLKISQYSQENTCGGPCRPSFTEHLQWLVLDFRGSKYFFQLNLPTGFCGELLWKHELNIRSSHWNSSLKNGDFRNFASFTGKHLCWSLFLTDLQNFRHAALLNRDFNTHVFLDL